MLTFVFIFVIASGKPPPPISKGFRLFYNPFWVHLGYFFPDAATSMGVEWWSLLNQLGYMRYNYLHFNYAELPDFTHGDALLAQSIDSLVTLTRALQQDSAGQSSPVLDALRFAMAE